MPGLGAGSKGLVVDEVERVLREGRGPEAVVDLTDIDCVRNIFPAYSTGERTRSFLKIQDGCDYKCSYCTVPYARGGSRSLPPELLLRQAAEIAASGIVEIVLTGVNTGDYGRRSGDSFLALLQGVDWIASGTKFLPHFHIPLQSGCDRILQRMGRRYRTEDFRKKIELIRSRMDRVFFGIDVIVGFPGETDEDFRATCSFLEEIRPAFIHVFPYSRRAGTPAAEMPDQVDEAVKTARVEVLERMCAVLHEEFCRENSGREEEVLFESKSKNGKMFGYTRNYIKVERPYDSSLIGKIVKVVLD